jgi:hypothetical protein
MVPVLPPETPEADSANSPTAMRQFSLPKNANETLETEKALGLVVKRIREAILDEVFKSGDHLGGGRTGGEI